MANRMVNSTTGEPLVTSEGKPLFKEESIATVELVGSVCGHAYLAQGPSTVTYSTDPTREDLVDEADKINADRVASFVETFTRDLCPDCFNRDRERLYEDALRKGIDIDRALSSALSGFEIQVAARE